MQTRQRAGEVGQPIRNQRVTVACIEIGIAVAVDENGASLFFDTCQHMFDQRFALQGLQTLVDTTEPGGSSAREDDCGNIGPS